MMRKILLIPVVPLVFLMTVSIASAVAADPYYRWASIPSVTCTTNGGNIEVLMASQPVQWDLPVDAQITLHYLANGVEYFLPSIPYDAPDGSGSMVYGPLLATFAISYPITFEFRMLTWIGGEVVYQSSYFAVCAADGAGTPSVANQVVLRSMPICLVPLPTTAVQGRLAQTTPTYAVASLDTPTTIMLPAGTAWYVIAGESGFYRLWIACGATPLWVPASVVTPNYDAPWNGAPLPASGA
ncbi:MAG: hypothetical protein IPO91_16575 [Chloroflexi bacterium]|nr:hypothetical protein [Chloroflexota bacterium]